MKLSECKEITTQEYLNLVDPKFEGQTRIDENMYWMIFSSQGVYYKVHHKLYDYN